MQFADAADQGMTGGFASRVGSAPRASHPPSICGQWAAPVLAYQFVVSRSGFRGSPPSTKFCF